MQWQERPGRANEDSATALETQACRGLKWHM